MIITKPKQSIFILLNKDYETKVFDTCPEKGLVFEVESLNYIEFLEVSKVIDEYIKNPEENKLKVTEFASKLIKKIHINNYNFTVEQFGFDTYLPILMELTISSRLKEEESFFFG